MPFAHPIHTALLLVNNHKILPMTVVSNAFTANTVTDVLTTCAILTTKPTALELIRLLQVLTKLYMKVMLLFLMYLLFLPVDLDALASTKFI
jgi:hypothetical protein